MRKNFLISIIVILFTISLGAQSLKKVPQEQQEKIIYNIEKNVSSVKTIQCDFQQIKNVSLLNDKVISKGKMFFSNGNLRWEYQIPYHYAFVVFNQQVFVKSENEIKKMDVQSSQFYKRIAQLMVSTISGNNLSQNNEFNVELYSIGTKYVAKLIPKQNKLKKMFVDINLHFNNAQNLVEKIVINEASGDKTTIEIMNAKTNVIITDSVFLQ